MITGIIKQAVELNRLLLSMIFLLLTACNNNKKCTINSNDTLIQEYRTSREILSLLQVDHGAFGYDVTLNICDSANNNLIETIGLRGEDYLPKIDSVIGANVYIHYNFPRNPKVDSIERLNFESVVLGDALINKNTLKYNYIFTNVKATD